MDQMTEYFDGLSWARITADTSAVITDMMELVRQHQARFPVPRKDAPCLIFSNPRQHVTRVIY